MAHPTDMHIALASLLVGVVVMGLFCAYSALALGGAHQIKTWRAAIVVVVVFVVAAVVWGWFGMRTGRAGLRVVRALIT
jgi:hypothetical protein